MRYSSSGLAARSCSLPKAKFLRTLVESLEKFPADFMADREQPHDTERRDPLS
jgi:hypothetical protein